MLSLFLISFFLGLMSIIYELGKLDVLLYGSIIILIVLIIFIYNKPNFEPRTIKKLVIQNKSISEIEKMINKWFSREDFELKKEQSNIFIGTKIINLRVKYIFKISIKEMENGCNLINEFYVLFDYNSNSPRESSLSNNGFTFGFIYLKPAWLLMENLIQNLQSN
jgi:hypothetical protein